MTSTLFPSSSLQVRKPYQYQPAARQNLARPAQPSVLFAGGKSQGGQQQEIFEHVSAPLLNEAQGEKTIIGTAPRKNTPEESARAKENFKRSFSKQQVVSHLGASPKMENFLKGNTPHHPEFSLPINFRPNIGDSANHAYFNSTNPEFSQVLDVLNKRINRNAALKDAFNDSAPVNFTLKLFSAPTKGVDMVYKKLLHAYGEELYPILDTAIESGCEGFNKDFKHEVDGRVSPMLRLDSLMGQEFAFDGAVPRQLSEFLHKQLGFGQNQLLKDHPDEQALIRNWRVKSAARYVMDRASTINSTWAEWGISAGISTLWSFALDIVGKNFAMASLLKRKLDKTDYNQLPGWQKALLGPPEKLYEPIIEAASPGKKTAAVAIGLMGQASAEVPDVLLVQGAIKNSDGAEGETLTKMQRLKKAGSGFMWAVKNKKMDTGLAVVSAAIGTSFEKVKELVWVPKSWGAKVGSALTGYVTNGVSVLACGLPFFTEGGPQRSKAGRILAKTYHPVTGTLKLPVDEHAALVRNGTLNGVKEFFERKAGEKLLHLSPTSRIVAASVPVALGVSVLPSTINAITTFLPEGLVAEGIKTGISWLQVPLFGPIELLAMNIVAKWNKSNPQRVTKLSKIGRPVINAVHAPFSMITKGIKGTYSYAKTGKWTPPYQEYQDFLNAIRQEA